ncbi:MAG TPA: DUF6297 family protein [Marmoricola sp.]|nr:DUF6297 family protein [Marmoricola sp.]
MFATLMFGSMLVNVVINVGRISDDLCASSGCQEARSLLPWLSSVALLVVTLALCRLFGPVFVTPAVDSWLVPAPVDRNRLLRSRLAATVAIAFAGCALLAAGTAVLGGFGVGVVGAFAALTALLATAAVAFAAVGQASRGLAARVLTWLLLLALALSLLALAVDRAPLLTAPSRLSPGWWAALAIALLLAVGLPVLAFRALGRLHRRDLAPGGSLAPGLSGALATLDLALLYDVLLAHRWHRHDSVRPRRGGPAGLAALVWDDLVRVRRTPQQLVLLAGGVVVPYAAEASGAGRVTVLIAALVGFLAVLPMLSALRLVTRTPGLARMLPFPTASVRHATVVVPGALAILFGIACGPALDRSLELPLPAGMFCGVAVGLSALASAVRWVTGRPPDYNRPLVSTPAGGVPTNLYGSIVRGFDILLLTTAPLLLSPTATGAEFSAFLSLAVLAYLTGRK